MELGKRKRGRWARRFVESLEGRGPTIRLEKRPKLLRRGTPAVSESPEIVPWAKYSLRRDLAPKTGKRRPAQTTKYESKGLFFFFSFFLCLFWMPLFHNQASVFFSTSTTEELTQPANVAKVIPRSFPNN